MKVAVVGSRTSNNFDIMVQTLDGMQSNSTFTQIISGGAKGADYLAELYARRRGIPVKVIPADWNTYGKRAGFLRNTTIVEESDIIVAFWDGKSRGTADTIDKARKAGKTVHIIQGE